MAALLTGLTLGASGERNRCQLLFLAVRVLLSLTGMRGRPAAASGQCMSDECHMGRAEVDGCTQAGVRVIVSGGCCFLHGPIVRSLMLGSAIVSHRFDFTLDVAN
jgi:hypothetical protein